MLYFYKELIMSWWNTGFYDLADPRGSYYKSMGFLKFL
jgi:hypothetical protein